VSYQQFQQQCSICERKWNAAFGIVGMRIIAEPPRKCPYCGSLDINKIAHGWEMGQTSVRSKFPFVPASNKPLPQEENSMTRIQEIEKKIKDLNLELEGVKTSDRLLNSGDPQAWAELLHSKKCRSNHTDGCSWEYESWDKPGYAHQEYLTKAHKLLSEARVQGIPPDVILKVYRLI
jgi:DNA-directed RNA polymerase subunit RPC12/RpoP